MTPQEQAFAMLTGGAPPPGVSLEGADAAFEQLTGRKPTTSAAAPPAPVEPESTLARRGRDIVGGAADVVDLLIAGTPALVGGAFSEAVNRVQGVFDSRSRKQIAEEGAAQSAAIGEMFGTPVRSALTNAGYLRKNEPGAVQQGLEKAMGLLERDAASVEERTGGKVLKQDYMMFVNGLFAMAGVVGTGAGTKTILSNAKAKAAAKELDRMVASRQAETIAADELAAKTPTVTELETGAVVKMPSPEEQAFNALQSEDVAAGLKSAELARVENKLPAPPETRQAQLAEAKLRRQRREDVRAAFAEDPYATDATVKLAEGEAERRAAAEAETSRLSLQGEMTPRTRPPQATGVDDTARLLEQRQPIIGQDVPPYIARPSGVLVPNEVMPRLAVTAPASLESGLAKVSRGRLFDLTSEERIAIRGSKQVTDPKIITAAAVGATGLGLAMALEPDAEEAALAIGAGALVMGRGKGLTLDALRKMPDAVSLGTILDQNAYTLNTLEQLPKNRFEFSKASVEQLLKRQEVTGAERGILQGVLEGVPGETITAKQLMEGVKEATGDFELKVRETPEYANHGLSAIDRVKYSADDPEVGDGIHMSEGFGPNATTRVYELPAGVSTAALEQAIADLPGGHTYFPNSMGHTRSFDADGVRHVVELQNNQAQYAEKALRGLKDLPAEEKATYEKSVRVQSALNEAWGRIAFVSGRAGDYDFFSGLRAAKKAHAKLKEALGHDDQFMVLEDRLFTRTDRASREGSDLTTAFAREWIAKQTPEMIKHFEMGHVNISEGFIDWLLAREKTVSPALAETMRAELQQYAVTKEVNAKRVLEESQKRLNSGSAAKLEYDRLAPMWKNWHKRLIREEIADAARVSDEAARLANEYRRQAQEGLQILRRERPLPPGGQPAPAKAWLKYADDLEAEAARAEKGNAPVIRFADADTVAKVEGWLDKREAFQEGLEGAKKDLRMAEEDLVSLRGMKESGDPKDHPYYSALKTADPEAFERVLAGVRLEIADAASRRERALKAVEVYTQKIQDTPRFSPEHQGIYDRYSGDVTKFLKQLGGKHVKDAAGHGWWEVPLEGSKAVPAGKRVQQFGGVDQKLMRAIAAVGGGAFLAAALSDEDKTRKAVVGGAVAGLAALAVSGHPGVRSWAKAAGHIAEIALGNTSTTVRGMSMPLLRRMTTFEMDVLKRTHDRMVVVAPFAEGFRKLADGPTKAALRSAVTTNDAAATLRLLGQIGDPKLMEGWRQARRVLNEVGEELQAIGRLDALRPDYFPRMVVDHEGLLNSLGLDLKQGLEKILLDADRKSQITSGLPLTALERTKLINKYLAQQGGTGKGRPGFLKQRKIGDIDEALSQFYAPPDEAVILYLRGATKEIEQAKFFGRSAIRDPATGRMVLEASVGNVVETELTAGRIKPEQAESLRQVLRDRHGPGEKAMNPKLAAIRDLTYMGLLGNAFSALVQTGDTAIAMAAHNTLPTMNAILGKLTRRSGMTKVADLGLVNHISEEMATTSKAAKMLNKTFKLSGFSYVDQAGKSIAVNAARIKWRGKLRTPEGERSFRKEYGDYFGDDMDALIRDLRADEPTRLVHELLFRELSDLQPISKLEMPQLYLRHPNGRVFYMLHTFGLKQVDIFRRKVVQQALRGDRLGALNNLLRFGIALGASGATTQFINNLLLGRDDKLEANDVFANVFRTFGYSEYAMDKPNAVDRVTGTVGQVLPPYKMWAEIVTADPKALQYVPLTGRLLHNRAEFEVGDLQLGGGAAKYNEWQERKKR